MKKLLFILLVFVPLLSLANSLCKLPALKTQSIATQESKEGTQLFFDNYKLTVATPKKIALGTPEIFYFDNDKKISLQPVPSRKNNQTQSFYNQVFGLSAADSTKTKDLTVMRNMLDIDCKKPLTQYKLLDKNITIIRADPTIAEEKPAYIYLYGKNDGMYLIEFYNFSDKEIGNTLSTLILR